MAKRKKAVKAAAAPKHKKQHGLRGAALAHAADRLEERKAALSAGTTLAGEVGTLTPREQLIVAFALHEVGQVLRASGSSERRLR